MPVLTIPRLGAAAAVLALGASAIPTPALADVGYTVPAGVSILQIVADGGRGGDAYFPGGNGCRVAASVEVDEGDEFTWTIGGNGGDVSYAATAQPGGVGGTGAYDGGDGGATLVSGTPGGGGGAATNVLLNSTEIIVAAGGGGASGGTGGGAGCGWNTAAGDNGYGSEGGTYNTIRAGGAYIASAGGVAGSADYGSAATAGNSSTDTPPGRGGDGGAGNNGGNGGPGGGGGVSGGGGSYGQASQYVPGMSNSAAAGLSAGPDAAAGVVPTSFTPNPGTGLAASGGVTINVVTIALDVPAATQGAPYSGSVSGTFAATEALTGYIALYTVSPSLPAGLVLDPSTGAITGTPTAPTSATDYTVTVRRIVSIEPPPPPGPDRYRSRTETYDLTAATDADVIAESTATFSLAVNGALPETGSSPLTEQLPIPAIILVTSGAALVALGARRQSLRTMR